MILPKAKGSKKRQTNKGDKKRRQKSEAKKPKAMQKIEEKE